jgi:alpha-glucoside transport system substrate-binding protein
VDRRRAVGRVAAVSAVALLATGCLSEGGGGTGGGGTGGGGGEAGDKKVEIFGNFSGAEADGFNASMTPFEEQSGIDVEYVSSPDFATLIRSRVQGNDAPDIALFPQPGLLTDIAALGGMAPVGEAVDLAAAKETLVPGLVEATELDGEAYGVPMRMAVKSVVWTPAPEFPDNYQDPATHDELLALTDQIKGTGTAPWCLGMENAQATGWVATDWIEEYVLRVGGPEFYEQWARHEVPFNHPTVVEAAEKFQSIWQPEGNVLGGAQAIVSTPFGTAGNPMFDEPPGCMMMRQGNFIASGDFFPSEVTDDLDNQTHIFQLPPTDPNGPAGQRPVLLGGDWATTFNAADEDVKQVMEFLASDEFGAEWAQAGGWLSPHTTFDASNYPDETTRTIASFATESTSTAVDASDVMPGAVGAGSFWEGMTAWIAGQQELQEVLDQIEANWPAE